MAKGLIFDNYNALFDSELETIVSSQGFDYISVALPDDNGQLSALSGISEITDINIRCVPDKNILESALGLRCKSVTIVPDEAHRLEYSFGIDVLKYKPLLREIASLCHSYNIRCGFSTDFRHENILHAQDCGADFVEIDFESYPDYREQYDLATEIAKERELDIIKKEQNILKTI